MLNRWRRGAYPASQRAWGSTGRRSLPQARAEAEMRALAAAGETSDMGQPGRESTGAAR